MKTLQRTSHYILLKTRSHCAYRLSRKINNLCAANQVCKAASANNVKCQKGEQHVRCTCVTMRYWRTPTECSQARQLGLCAKHMELTNYSGKAYYQHET